VWLHSAFFSFRDSELVVCVRQSTTGEKKKKNGQTTKGTTVKQHRANGGFLGAAALALAALSLGSTGYCGQIDFTQTNLVSDIPGEAAVTDPNLVNPWGIVASSSSPFWVSDNGSGVSTLYSGAGAKLPLTVTVPTAANGTPPSAPTGVVFNGTTDFNVGTAAPAHFIFDTEDGTISGWNTGNSAVLEVDNSATGAVYKGLAIANNGTANHLYATNFNSGKVEVYNSSFAPTSLTGSFTDPTLPTGFAPFNIQDLNGDLFVTYAEQDAAKHDDVAGPGLGFVDEYDLNGDLLGRLVSNGPLDSPWGLAMAPTGFGNFGGDLLVGNFGDGTINAFNPTNGDFVGTLDGTNGSPLVIQGLWGLSFGNGAGSGNADTLYFTAGIPGTGMIEDHGLFGSLTAVPDSTSTIALLGMASAILCSLAAKRRLAGVSQ
jgi:uncharacterized protein (TIGR03118 family)